MISDFLIIGGGIAGASAAARLSALGRVTLLEAETSLGYHASGRSAATYEEFYGKPAVVALTQASKPYLLAQGVLSPRGMLVVARADQRASFAATAADHRLQLVSVEQALACVPILNSGVIALAASGAAALDIDTDRLLQTFVRETRGNGGEVLTGARVAAIQRTADGWEVDHTRGTHSARILVNAAGSWVDQIAAMAGLAPFGFTPLRRSMARIPAPGGHDVSGWPMLFGPGEEWYAKPDAGALIVSPAEEHLMDPHDAFADDLALAEGLARYEAMVTEPVTRLLSSWAGLRTFAPDRVLVIGQSAQDPAFYWIAGQGGYGFQTSPAASALLADLVAGRPPALPPAVVAALSPSRFVP